MLSFTPLASSSDGCCYVVRSGGHSLLVDAGISFPAIQRGLRFQVSGLSGALISHAHGDHSKAVVPLMKAGVDVFASKEAWGELGYFDERSNTWPSHRAKLLHHREQFALGAWHVQPFDAVHDSPGTLGFLISAPSGGRLLYLTDSAYSLYRFHGLTHIAIEANFSREKLRENAIAGTIHGARHRRTTATHMSIERLIEMLKANDLSEVVEIHLLHLSSENSDEEDFKLRVQRATGKPVYVAAHTSEVIK